MKFPSVSAGDRSISYFHASVEKSPYRRGQRDRLAKNIKGHLQKEKYLCNRIDEDILLS